MKDEAKSQLTKIIGDYDAKLTETERVASANRAADASFPERFLAFRSETIRPALEEIASMLNAAGHDATVREQEESSSTVGGVKAAAVSLRLVPKPFAHKSTETGSVSIEVMFSANRAERKLIVSSTNTMVSHGGSVGKRGAYDLDAVTPEVVATHVIQTLGDAFIGPR
jgi:vancomycin resistance protein YoaR